MAVSDGDDDDAQQQQQLDHDAKLALQAQVEENVKFAVAQRQQTAVPIRHESGDAGSVTASSVLTFQDDDRTAASLATRPYDQDEYEEVSSMSVAREASLIAADGDESSYMMLSVGGRFSDISSFVVVAEEEKKSSSPILISGEETSSYDVSSSDYSSSYAARASAAISSAEKHVTDGVGVVRSVSLLRQEESVASGDTRPLSESSTSATTGQVRAKYYYAEEDPIFQALFGDYNKQNDPLLISFKPPNGAAVNINMIATNQTSFSLAIMNATLVPADPKLQLKEYCERTFQSSAKPEFRLIDMTGPLRDRTFHTVVQHPSIDTAFVGSGKSQLESEEDAARKALESLQVLTVTDVKERAKNLTISFRAAAAKLPFCLRFQLERSLHIGTSTHEGSQLRMKKRPAKRGEEESFIFRARKTMIVYLQAVLPPLLGIDWDKECGGKHCFALSELFAYEIWDHLVEVNKAIGKRPIDFFASDVERALEKAREYLRIAEEDCNSSEAQLSIEPNDCHQYVETIRKRSRFPVAMYSCKFDLEGNLVPTDMQVLNRGNQKGQFVEPQSRRALREAGWPVRDRFVHMSSVKFGTFNGNLVDYVRKTTLCNREYVYLFDKGTGKPSIWLYSQPTEGPNVHLSRDALLGSLGDFSNVAATKLGDRISLAFTQTTPIVAIPMDCILAEPELVGNGYRFSDGCGVMGRGIAREVQSVLKLKEVPGAIQIRMGGVKGMLSYKYDYPENKIGLRPSMVKFPSEHRLLEVKRVAIADRNPPLFSQLILVLHHQKVLNRTLLRLQAEACASMAKEFDSTMNRFDDNSAYDYTRTVVKHGRKHNGSAFSQGEFEDLARKMKEAKTRVNLRCGVTLMFGVVDEHRLLEEGTVLVSSGAIQGKVLLSRSPCLMPGDIQKAKAVAMPKTYTDTYTKLKNTVVFSAKGQRPLADCLGGGDLDGDQFYIIHEEDLTSQMQSVEPHDYGSQEDEVSIANIRIDVRKSFAPFGAAPDLSKQLAVLKELMALGDIVSLSSDAWIRVADIEGPGSDRAMIVADLCQHALDARKLAFQIDKDQLIIMHDVREKYPVPRWRDGGEGSRVSNSILGILHQIWSDWISDLEKAKIRRLREYPGFDTCPVDPESKIRLEADEETVTDTVADTVASNVGSCIVCWDTGVMHCSLCGETVWLCSDECKRMHENEAGHTRGSSSTITHSSMFSQDSNESFDLMPSGVEALLDVVFGRERPSCSGIRTIDFRMLTERDLVSLSNMVLAEFYKSLNDSLDENSTRLNSGTPHEYDVFLMSSGELAVCRRDRDDHLVWEFKDKSRVSLDDSSIKFDRRIASLSGACRILDSLAAKPAAGSLMEQAMKRMVVPVSSATESIPLGPPSGYLNESQQHVLSAAVSMRSGILAVQGPPGCGKSSTIVEIVAALQSGVLCCAPSNAAVANLARRLVSTGSFSVNEVVVFGENCDESVQFLNPILRHQRWERFFKDYRNATDNKEKKKMLQEFAWWLHIDVNQERLLTATRDHARLDHSDLSGKKVIASAKVLLCTLNTAGSPKLQSAANYKFPTILLDEASQAPEAEFYILTTFPGVKKIVVVGDPKQLPSTVVHEGCENAGYGESFLRHVLEYFPEKVHLLDIQYRMDPKILQFSNETFYSNRVTTDTSVLGRKLLVESPFLVFDTSEFGRKVERRERSSWKNESEAIAIKHILCNDKDILRVRSEVVRARTIIVTPYKAQMLLLERELKKIKSFRHSLDIATVDSFQGQEGDIVIVSTVRTETSGFVDSPNRLNVAMTRAKRVLRVVGNMEFFSKIPNTESALQKLATFADQNHVRIGLVAFSELNNLGKTMTVAAAWMPTDWSVRTSWKPTMTSRFHDCLKGWRRIDRNVAFNTLFAVSSESVDMLTNLPVDSDPPRWQTSSLRSYDRTLQVVWIAKELEQGRGSNVDVPYKGIVEAHFAGSRNECLQFKQRNHLVPRNACRVRRDMSSIIRSNHVPGVHSTEVEVAWEIDNDTQDAVVDDTIPELPGGLFLLDEYQESIIALQPPLLLESRSGMGKTEILFKHSILYPPSGSVSRTCFVTVSAKLCRALKTRYEEAQQVHLLPRVSFYSFLGSRTHTESGTDHVQSFVDLLLRTCRIAETEMSVKGACTFFEYVSSRKSHERLQVDPGLVESEIGGVILGSLAAAMKKGPLSREEYLAEIRSNVPNDSQEAVEERNAVYDEYERYHSWKLENQSYDTNDIVLRLIDATAAQTTDMFQSAYLDEVQDFSYASLFLICNIAGKTEARWTAAGDTAQLISPGCSFTFKGFKETILSIRGDVKLRKVVRLKRNYRMNRGTLECANAIIKVIKQNFPKAIESYQEEEAMKDLGLKVVLLDWEKALAAKTPAFGPQQAVVYASDTNLESVGASMNSWLNNHPFILSSLDSKGLEFDDVVVVFSFERKTWDVKSRRISSLRMCRELYVAVTRAKRRAVILMKRNSDTMVKFFEDLDCDLEVLEPEVILQEFQKETSKDEWRQRGEELFEDQQYKYAASCFRAAMDDGRASYAEGFHFYGTGKREDAKVLFRTAANIFFESQEFKMCLEAYRELGSLCLDGRSGSTWDEADNDVLDAALDKLPGHLPRRETVNFALLRGSWRTISAEDMCEYSDLFHLYRGDVNLRSKIHELSEEERENVKGRLPLVIADYDLDTGRLADAIECFLRGGDQAAAMAATESAISGASKHEDLPRIADCWRRDAKARGNIPADKATISLLVSLFESPRDVSTSRKQADACMNTLGRSVVKLAVDTNVDAGVEELYAFSPTVFKMEVSDLLMERYNSMPIEIVRWYQKRNGKEQARAFAEKHLSTWSSDELLGTILTDKEVRPVDLITELAKPTRKLLVNAARVCLSTENFDLMFAKRASEKALSSVKMAQENVDELLKAWNARRNSGPVKEFLSQDANSSSMALLWLLFAEPETAARRHGKKCMRLFGKDVVRNAVLKKKGSDKSGAYKVLCLFDRNKFEADKPLPAQKPQDTKGSKHGDTKPAGYKGGATKRTYSDEKLDKLNVNERVVVTGLTKRADLNGQPGRVQKQTRDGSYLVVLDRDKPKPNGKEQKQKLHRSNLRREQVEPSDSSDDSGPPDLMQRARDGRINDDDSNSSNSDSSQSTPPPRSGASRGKGDAPPKLNTESDDSMPSLFHQGGESSSEDDVRGSVDDDDDLDDLPELESKESSAGSTDSNAATKKSNKDKYVPSQVQVKRQQETSHEEDSDDDLSVPPLEKRPSPHGQDGSSDSSQSDMPHLLSGESSSDDSSVPELEMPPRVTRNESSEDISEDGDVPIMTKRSRFQKRDNSDSSEGNDGDNMPIPGLEFAHGAQSSSGDDDDDDDDDDDSSDKEPPVLIPRPRKRESIDSDGDSSPSDDDIPELVDRGGGGASNPQAQAQEPNQSSSQENASSRKKQKGRNRKGRRGRGGRGRK